MRKRFLAGLFAIGIGAAAFFWMPKLLSSGTYTSIAIDFRDDIPIADVQAQLASLQANLQIAPRLNSAFSGGERLYIIEGDAGLLARLRKLSLGRYVESIEPNYIYKAFGRPNDPEYTRQWHLQDIHVETAWEDNRGGGVTVAVIDTGVSKTPDMEKTNFVAGYDFVSDSTNANDDNGHGTHVAGTIAQSTNNNYGVAGIAYEAKIMPMKVLSAEGFGTTTDIAEAIRWAADNKADIINMSLGGGGESAIMKEAIDYAYKKGVTIVAAAGNENTSSASYPALYPHVIAVSATGATGEKASYSNYGAGVDIAAPGGDGNAKVWQETIDPDNSNRPILAGYNGTSMASPHVAGVAALVKAAGITDPDGIERVLLQSARRVTEDPHNYFGQGHLDATAAVKLARQGRVSFWDFFRWLRDSGYLNPLFWFDGGAVALLPKIAMVLGSYLLAVLIRYISALSMGFAMQAGMLFGGSGLFFFQCFQVVGAPQWPFRLMGSSLSEVGNAAFGSSLLNPLFASILIPFAIMAVLWSNRTGKGFATGISIGMAAALGVSAAVGVSVWGLGAGLVSTSFLAVNACLCFSLAWFAARPAH